MILFVLFLSLYIGLNFKTIYILGIIESVAVIAFSFYRFKKKVGVIATITLLIGVGISFIKPTYDKSSYQSLVIEVRENYYIASSGLERLYVYEKGHEHEIGDIVILKGKKKILEMDHLESDFDFQKYLENKGIYSEFLPEQSLTLFSNPIKIHKLRKEFLSHFDSDTRALISSLLFGMGESEETISSFRSLHLTRLISNSGLYLSIFFNGLLLLLKRLFKKKYAYLGGLTIFAIYSIFAFPRFVVVKFLLLHILMWVNEYLLKKKFSYLEVVSILGIFFLLFDYHLAFQDGFFLSFYIPILIYFYNSSFKWIKNKYRKLFIPIIVALAFIPFAIDYYHEISPMSVLLQIIFMPLMIIFAIFSLLSFIGIPIYSLLNGFCHFLNIIINFIKPICFKIYAPSGGASLEVIYEIIYLVILYFVSIRFVDIYKWFLVLIVPITLILVPIKNYIIATVSFINVGQGDSCLIQSGGTSIMIDTGGLTYKDIATSSLIPYLKNEQIYDIDLLITTHDDFDHSGGVNSLINNFKVKTYVKDYQYFPINIGNLTLYNYNNYPSLWKEENDESLVIYFSIKGNNFIITGDAPIKIEKQIIKDYPSLKVDYLKVGHHGSKTSTSSDFIKTIKPKEAIISCGKNNRYGHPHKEVLSVLKNNKVTIRRTDLEGTIKYSFL